MNEDFEAFTRLVDKVVAAPASTVKERIERRRKDAERNPNRPGPKPNTVKPSASAHASGGQD